MVKAKAVKKKLKNIIQEMAQNKDLFVKNPGKDFSRNRKLNFETMMKLMITMEDSVKQFMKTLAEKNRLN